MGLFSLNKAAREQTASMSSFVDSQNRMREKSGLPQIDNPYKERLARSDKNAAAEKAVKNVAAGGIIGGAVGGPVGAVVGSIAGLAKNNSEK